METSLGNIKVKLYDDTPAHRDNFIKLVEEGYYDGTLFHRVINEFMIQGGDGTSKNAPAGKMLGTGDPGYTIPAEFVYPKYFHKRGALAAARQGDQVNPDKASSGSQFYIVTGKVFNPGQIDQLERQMQMQQEQSVFQSLAANHREEIMNMRRNRDMQGLQALQDTLIAQTYEQIKKEGTQAQQALQQAVDGWNAAQNADAAGELLFAAANAMRLAGVDAEEALTFASRRFCDACLQQEQRGIQADAPAPIEETK